MPKKPHNPAPVPPKNRSKRGKQPTAEPEVKEHLIERPGFQEQDPKRRLGDFTGAGEHSLQQPGPLNDGKERRRGVE
jgi:hypothetical protein